MRLLVLLLALGSVAAADEQTLRIGTIIPEGTSWARELRAMARGVDTATNGALKIKWYMGGIAGDEQQMMDRVRRGQLDGILSGGMACEDAAPSLRVARIPGLLQTWGETSYVLGELRPTLAAEAQQRGWAYLGEAIVGPSIVFSKKPIASLDDLRKSHVWLWDLDKALLTILPAMDIPVVPLPIREALLAYDAGRVDVLIGSASVALGFQWSATVRYYTDLKLGFIVGCFLVSATTFDALPLAEQQELRLAGAKAKVRFEDVGRTQEGQLLGTLFKKQGLQPVAVDEAERSAFFDAARAARDRVATRFIPRALIDRVLGILADFRSTH